MEIRVSSVTSSILVFYLENKSRVEAVFPFEKKKQFFLFQKVADLKLSFSVLESKK